MIIDLMQPQTRKFPIYEEWTDEIIGELVPDHNGYLTADNEDLEPSDVTYFQFDYEDGEEKFYAQY